MSVNKILALIGAILASFAPLIFLIMGVGMMAAGSAAGISGTYSFSSDYEAGTQALTGFSSVMGGLLIFGALIAAAMVVFEWLAFAKMEGEHAAAWRLYLLIAGIVTCVVGVFFGIIGAAPGVLFILAYALNRKAKPAVATATAQGSADSPISESQSLESSESSSL